MLNFGVGLIPSVTAALQGAGVVPPAGFIFLTDFDGAYLTDADGYYLVEAA